MDELAGELKIDPYRLRLINAFEAGNRTATGQILKEPVTLKRCMEQAAGRIGWTALRSSDPQGVLRRGVGMAASFRGISVGGSRMDSASALVSAHDVGRAINPALVSGQIYGGVCMGLGTALMEEYKTGKGKQVILNFDQYLIPTASDRGSVEAVIIEGDNPEGPFGASSIAEPAIQIVAPAIVNAVAHAAGTRVRHLPADLEKVFLGHALESKSTRGSELSRHEKKL